MGKKKKKVRDDIFNFIDGILATLIVCQILAAMPESECPGFEPQTYLKDRCKKCFRLKSKHPDASDAAASTAASAVPTTSTAPGNW